MYIHIMPKWVREHVKRSIVIAVTGTSRISNHISYKKRKYLQLVFFQ